jgi:hypothetical protein
MEQGCWQRSRSRAPQRDRTNPPAARPTVEEFEGRVLLAASPLGDINAGTTASSNPAGSAGRGREVVSPFPSASFRAIRVLAIDTDGNGITEAVRVTAKNSGGNNVSRIFTL